MSAGRLQVPPDHAYGIKCIGSDTTVLAGFPVCKLPQTSPNFFQELPSIKLSICKICQKLPNLALVRELAAFDGARVTLPGRKVGDCLRGWYTEEEQKAEPDLGKCIKALLFPQADSRRLMTISLQFQCIISH